MLDRHLEPDYDPREDWVRRDELPDFDKIHRYLTNIREIVDASEAHKDDVMKIHAYIHEIRELLGDW